MSQDQRSRANWEYIATEQSDLRKSWHELVRRFTTDDAAASGWYATLAAAYQSADRHYHNLEHVGQVLAWIEYSREASGETRMIAKYAAWFHDSVYDSRA